MNLFRLSPTICECADFATFAAELSLDEHDLILTNVYIFEPRISSLRLNCQVLFQEEFGSGEPSDQMVDAILETLRNRHFHRLIAVGGGTIIDIAKILAVAEPESTVDSLYALMDRLQKHHPLYIVPTTCGTGSEVTAISIVNRTAKGVKQGLVSDAMYADCAVLIPEMLAGLPYRVFATSSIDAMIHAVESYLSPNATCLSTLFSCRALELLLPGWERCTFAQDCYRKELAPDFLRAATYAGIAFSNAGVGAVHALSYPLSGTRHVPHGESNHAMFAAVMKKYIEKNSGGKLWQLSLKLSSLLHCEAEEAFGALEALANQILPRKPLQAYGVTQRELQDYTKSVLETQQRLLKNNYISLSERDIAEIYKDAY